MRPLKKRGIDEVRNLRNRVYAVRAKNRISQADAEYLYRRLDEMEARIVAMAETDEYGREVR